MLELHLMKRRFLVWVVFLSFFLLSSPVQADNDTIGIDCQISIAGQSPSTSTETAPEILANSSSGQNFTYNVSVCGDLSLLDTLGTDETPIMAVGLYRWEPFSQWQRGADLTLQGGCLVGTWNQHAESRIPAIIDIEGSRGTPICGREYAYIVNRAQSQVVGFNDAMDEACDSLTISPEQPVSGDEVITSLYFPPPLCGPTLHVSESGDTFFLKYQLIRLVDNHVIGDYFAPRTAGSLCDPRVLIRENLEVGNYAVRIFSDGLNPETTFCSQYFSVGTPNNPGGVVDHVPGTFGYDLCGQIPDTDLATECNRCKTVDGGIWTAVGCIKHEPENIIQSIIKIGLSVAGGSALLMIMVSGFIFSISRGDPKRTGEAKEMLTSAIIGLLFIIFSVTILQFIGVSILKLPGFAN